ncbi:MAG: HAMP domain-containing sensor histidine kinase [Candidatus Paceibacterota bacterium]
MRTLTHDIRPHDRRLSRFFFVAEAVLLGAYIFFGCIPFLFPGRLIWIEHPLAWLLFWIAIAGIHAGIIVLLYLFQKPALFSARNISHAVFYLGIVYLTGGIVSPFFIILVIPPLLSTIALRPAETAGVSAFIVVSFGSFAFLPPYSYADQALLVWLLVQILSYCVIAILLYGVANELRYQHHERRRTQRVVAEQTELDRIKSTYINTVSRRLEAPLSGVVWGLNDLLENTSDAKSRDRALLKKSHDRAERALGIVNTMTEAAALNADNLSHMVRIRKIDLHNLIETAIDDLAYLSERTNVTVSFANAKHVTANADPTILIAALTSLLDNAIRYAPGGSVTVSLDEKGSGAAITISDTGIGIPKSDQAHLFDRLYRASNAIAVSQDGTGIGLYNARRVIEMHGGTLKVTSEEGKGTTVTVTL